MWEILSKAGQFIGKTAVTIGTGKAQSKLGLQSPELPTAMVRWGRFLYVASGSWIAVSWYTAFHNEHTKEGEQKFILPGSKLPVISAPSRKDKTLPGMKKGSSGPMGAAFGSAGEAAEGATQMVENGMPFSSATAAKAKGRTLVAITPAQLGTPGTAMSGYLWSAPDKDKQMPEYSSKRYKELVAVASTIANRFKLKITSGYRPGSTGSMHSVGLAFDMVGRETDMKRAAVWAAKNPGMFQEIFIHNEGSGLHLHIAFYPDAAGIFSSSMRKYESARPTQAPAPAMPMRRGTLV